MTPPRLRRSLIVGNWKMNKTLEDAVAFARALTKGLSSLDDREVVLCPSFTSLAVVAEVVKGAPVRLGAQNLHWEAQGAFTGEISATQLLSAGCRYVIAGHSERRHLLGETDGVISKKLKAALQYGLIPIFCVGETLPEREAQQTYRVLERQVSEGLKGFSPADLASLVVAYEPVWAIGTGKTAQPHQAQDAHLFIRKLLARLFNPALSQSVRILYGGSVKTDNVDALMSQPDVDGVLVGGESLKAESFLRIIRFQAAAALQQVKNS